ncbi:cytidyltransferase [Synechococcus phage S-SM1]|jgi:hypothetical protein|uniref:Gp185 n=1 Tax=Synechococcus phage S-SM1 TaxID=444859 RepID=E3SIJ8_9CAUD|nr:cytidyltransferase [Synechococcus phage S-SM1]ADO97159.1 hypothetical protein SSM1_191 [Synechococcus phage S-SM1]
MNLNELPDMSDALKKVQQFDEKKKEKELDPVGQEDDDVDNDGDSDSSDKYLKNRRKAIAKAMKKEEVENVEEGKFSGSKSHIQRDGTAPAPERTAAERKKDRRILAGYGKGGMEMAVDRAKKERDERRAARKEAFLFSDEELETLVAIDEATDEELVAFFEEIISEMAEDDQDLIEICEALEDVELLSEDYYDSAVKASKAASKTPEAKAGRRKLRVQRMKSAAKAAGAKLKAGAKAAGSAAKKAGKAAVGAGARAAGHAVGEFQAQRIKSKRAAMERTPAKKKEASKSSDDDGTGGKLDKLLADTRGKSSSSGSSSSGGGGSSDSGSSSSGSTRKAVGGALRKVGSLLKKGLKKAVGKTARAVSKGSDKLAKRMNEDYDKIASLYESGLFSIEEIENVIEEGYKEIDRKKENAMYRRAGNLSREALSKGMNTKAGSKAQDKSGKIVSAISRQKEKERFSKMADIKARSNYGG